MLYDALDALSKKNTLSFHMPGHDGALKGFECVAKIDTTELYYTDNLHAPVGIIAEAQNAAAKFFGVKKSCFLVNGSSCGIHAAVAAFVSNGEKIIADRACHQSFINALVFCGGYPVWAMPKMNDEETLWGAVSAETIAEKIKENPDAKAVFITSPNYFGVCADVKGIAKITHAAGMVLIVDAAHGAHFGLSASLPKRASAQGADIVITSAHKTLSALTQCAFLNANIESERLARLLAMFQTSSPSYVLMASLDSAREDMENRGGDWERICDLAKKYFPEQGKPLCGEEVRDVTRLVIETGVSPYKAEEILREEYNIEVECCYGGGVVCITHLSHTEADFARLKFAIDEINSRSGDFERIGFSFGSGAQAMPPRGAFFGKTRECAPNDAVGHIAARNVFAYPPAVCAIAAGEEITAQSVNTVERIRRSGGQIIGNYLILDETADIITN